MRTKITAWILVMFFVFVLTACGKTEGYADDDVHNGGQSGSESQAENVENKEPEEAASDTATSGQPGAEDTNILIAYFSRVGNTDFPVDVDAVSSASLVRKDGELYGNTQYIASMIQQSTGGDLFLIETAEKYPMDYDETDEQGMIENRDRTRPELASHVENLDSYDIVFLGFPNWYYDMPMAVYTFLEEHDLSGKTVIPFATSGGGGFSDAISEIQNQQPGAVVLSDGFHASHSRIDDVTLQDVQDWIDGLPLSHK